MLEIPGPTSEVTATQLVRNYPQIRRMSDETPISITAHGRCQAVLLSPARYAALTARKQENDGRDLPEVTLALDATEDLVLILDYGLCVQQANRAARRCLAAEPGELEGRKLAQLARSPSDEFLVSRVASVLASGRPETLMVPALDDPSRVLQVAIKPWPGGVALFGHDVTERLRFRDSTIAQQAADRTLAALQCIGTARIRADGTLLAASPSFAALLGRDPASLIGEALQACLEPDARQLIDKAFRRREPPNQCRAVRYFERDRGYKTGLLAVIPYDSADLGPCASSRSLAKLPAAALYSWQGPLDPGHWSATGGKAQRQAPRVSPFAPASDQRRTSGIRQPPRGRAMPVRDRPAPPVTATARA